MTKKVLILSSSLRPNSNSEQLAREAGRGAVEAGHDVEVLSLAGRDLRYCEGCMACHRLLYCPIQDDANDLIKKVQEADVVVFASPIYYYDICGQLKTFLDRTNPLYGSLTASAIFTSLPYRPTTRRTRQNGPYRRSMAGSAASTKPVMPVASTPAA